MTTGLGRVVGLDVARALALLGMFATHVGNADAATGWPWLAVTHGRSAALFAVLAGVSMALMLTRRATRAGEAPARQAVRHTRVRIAVRALLLIVLGWMLSALGTPVDVILDNLGVMMLLALPALRWRPAVAAGVGIGLLVAGFWLLGGVRDLVPGWLYSIPVLHELWSPHYPALSWVGYVLLGIGIGRWAPWRGRALLVLGVVGTAVAAGFFAAGRLLGDGSPGSWTALIPHAYTPFEMLSNAGFAAGVMSLCVFVAPRARRLVWPLAATGSMTLTLYTAHVMVIAVVGDEIVRQPSNLALVTLCAGCIGFSSLWRWQLGQGPLERLLSRASSRVADAVARS